MKIEKERNEHSKEYKIAKKVRVEITKKMEMPVSLFGNKAELQLRKAFGNVGWINRNN